MKITFSSPPEPGKVFSFTVHDSVGNARIKASLKGTTIRESDCPDPPCHDFVHIPEGTHGVDLLLTVEDFTGKRHEERLRILDRSTTRGGQTAG
jgi:hypothetical protein